MEEPPAHSHHLRDRIRAAGLTSWAVIGISFLVYGFARYLVGPVSVVFAPLAIAIVIVYLLNPLVARLERRGVRRGLGVLVIYFVFLVVTGLLVSFLVPIIARQISSLIDTLPSYVQRAVDRLNRFLTDRGTAFRIRITSQQIVDYFQANRRTVVSFIGGIGSVAGQILEFIITAVIGLILSVYILLDLPKIQRAFVLAIPADYREETLGVLERIGSALGGFFRGQLLVATFVGVASAIALTLVGLPFAVVIGLVAGIFNLIPLIGPFLAAIPAIMVGVLSEHPSSALWACVALLIVQQIDNHIISPNVMGRTVRLHPVTVMLAILAGGTIAGIFGMLVVIPLVATSKIVLAHFWSKRETLGAPPVAD